MEGKIENFIGWYKDVLPEGMCEEIIKNFDTAYDLGYTYNRQSYDDGLTTMKNDESYSVNIPEHYQEQALYHLNGKVCGEFEKVLWEQCYPHYASHYSALMDFDHHNNYGSKVQRTQVGQGYHIWHCESGSRSNCNRVLAYILYLNDVDEGGETEFLYQHKRVKPTKNTLVLFPAGLTHTHRGNPPLSNTKYIITGWIEM